MVQFMYQVSLYVHLFHFVYIKHVCPVSIYGFVFLWEYIHGEKIRVLYLSLTMVVNTSLVAHKRQWDTERSLESQAYWIRCQIGQIGHPCRVSTGFQAS